MYSIEANDVWIKFNIQFVKQTMSLRRYLVQLANPGGLRRRLRGGEEREKKDFWALRGINLRVEPGEAVGLIGANGAGKSTFLMTMAGIYHPDRGRVTIRGTVGTLLSLGGGFTNDLTGAENIRQSGIFLGLPMEYIDAHFDEIVEMADLGEFINAPLRTYSSGMRARLGFAIAVHVNPDVILLDEVLEVGDQAFRRKSANLLERFKSQGKTVIIASHNVNVLGNSCSRVVWLEHGEIKADGKPEEIIKRYQNSGARVKK